MPGHLALHGQQFFDYSNKGLIICMYFSYCFRNVLHYSLFIVLSKLFYALVNEYNEVVEPFAGPGKCQRLFNQKL